MPFLFAGIIGMPLNGPMASGYHAVNHEHNDGSKHGADQARAIPA
jgi:hypothetical protein